ncbi:zinc ribbon domain-containing protein [Streptomyces sp. O3]
MTTLTYKTARYGGQLVKVPAPYTSQRCSACGFQCNADWNAARNILHLYRIGHIIVEVPAAGRRGRRAGETVKPVAAR